MITNRNSFIKLFIFIALLVQFACTKNLIPGNNGPVIEYKVPQLNSNPGNFSSCQEIENWSREKSQEWQDLANSIPHPPVGLPMASSMPMAANSESVTNTQEIGVEESDLVKTDRRSIFVARSHSLEVVRKDDLRITQTVAFPNLGDIHLFSYKNHLVAIGSKFNSEGSLEVLTYRSIEDDSKLRQISDQTFVGRLVDSRMMDGKLLLVLNSWATWNAPWSTTNGKLNGVPCEKIQKPVFDDFTPVMTSIFQVPIGDPSATMSLGRIGMTGGLYATKHHLYLTSGTYSALPYFINSRSTDQILTKFDLTEEGPQYRAAGQISGKTRNQWAFHESQDGDILVVATTDRTQTVTQNRLLSLAQINDSTNLVVVGHSADFAAGEDIRSVRYIDDKAYVVTFEKTDPLYVFNLHDPTIPFELGHLNVPGFSAYLHPVGNELLLGIGYGAMPESGFSWLAGVQLSLFDVTHPGQENLIQQVDFGGRYSHADVTADHHAFFFDQSSGLAVIPIVLLRVPVEGEPWVNSQQIEFSGAVVFKVGQDLKELGRLSHWEWVPQDCRKIQSYGAWWDTPTPSMDIRRIFRWHGNLVSISPFGIKISDPRNNFRTLREVRFANPESECSPRVP